MNKLGDIGSGIGGLIGASMAPGIPTGAGLGATRVGTPGYQLQKLAGGSVELSRSPEMQGLLSQQTGIFNTIGDLRSQVTPGFGRLTEALVKGIRNAATESIGNLREQFAKRRVQGASFAEDAIGRQELMFGEAESAVRAKGFLEELQLTTDLLDKQHSILSQQIDLNFKELGLAQGTAASLQSLIASANDIDKHLAAKSAAAYGAFGAQIGGAIGGGFGSGSSLYGGGASGVPMGIGA